MALTQAKGDTKSTKDHGEHEEIERKEILKLYMSRYHFLSFLVVIPCGMGILPMHYGRDARAQAPAYLIPNPLKG